MCVLATGRFGQCVPRFDRDIAVGHREDGALEWVELQAQQSQKIRDLPPPAVQSGFVLGEQQIV